MLLTISGRSGEIGLVSRAVDAFTEIAGSASTLMTASVTSLTVSSGSSRQFTFAVARCGSALCAWPADTIVATHVVRRSALK